MGMALHTGDFPQVSHDDTDYIIDGRVVSNHIHTPGKGSIEIPMDIQNPDGPGKAIAQATLNGKASVTDFSVDHEREYASNISLKGSNSFVVPISDSIEISMTVRLYAPLVYANGPPVSKKSTPFEKKPPKPGLKRKIVFQEYSK